MLDFQSHLHIYTEVLRNKRIKEFIQNFLREKRLHPNAMDKLLQTAHAYVRMQKEEVFTQILEKERDHYQEELDQALVEILAESLGIQLEKGTHLSLEGWNTKYISNLTSNEVMIEQKRDSEEVLALYKEMLKATFENRFSDFIENKDQENEVWRDIARHNEKIKESYEQLGIDWEAWNGYQKTEDFIVETEKEVNAFPRFIALLKERTKMVKEEVEKLQANLTEREYLPLLHIIDGTKGQGIDQLKDYAQLKERYDKFEERVKFLQEKHPEIDFATLREYLDHLKEAIDLFKEKNKKEVQTFQKGFRVKLWDRDPKHDLFQGNYTHCCIAVGVKPGEQEGGLDTHDPSTVMQYLVDEGIQVAEVKDEVKGTIAQVWLFVSRDELGEPILVADNFEVHKDYVSDSHINDAIRDHMFQFLRDYAKAMHIGKVGLGRVGTNDVDYENMPIMNVPGVDKAGGYLADYTLNISGRKERYYLETYNNHTLAEIINLSPRELETERKRMEEKVGTINIIESNTGEVKSFEISDDLLNQISSGNRHDIFEEQNVLELEEIEKKSFGDAAEEIETLLSYFRNPKGIQFLFKKDGSLEGYLVSLPANEFSARNESFDASGDNLYIESIAGKTSLNALKILKEKAKEAGYKKISMHGINERFNKILKERFGFQSKEVIDNWYAGKSAEYMELEL